MDGLPLAAPSGLAVGLIRAPTGAGASVAEAGPIGLLAVGMVGKVLLAPVAAA